MKTIDKFNECSDFKLGFCISACIYQQSLYYCLFHNMRTITLAVFHIRSLSKK